MGDLTGGRLVARVLKQAGVGHVFTVCGGHILPIYDGGDVLRRGPRGGHLAACHTLRSDGDGDLS